MTDAPVRLSSRLSALREHWLERAKDPAHHIFFSSGLEICADHIAPLIAACAALEQALGKIDAIRNSIIGHQSVNWSEHIYPLVAALEEAGYKGEGHDVSRQKAVTLHEHVATLEARCAALEQQLAALTPKDPHP